MRSTHLDCVVRRYEPGDAPAVAELMTIGLGPGPLGARTTEFFEWKHSHNPFGPSELLVAEMDGRIVGLRAFMRWRFEGKAASVSAVRAVDTTTHPGYRGLGIFSRLTRAAVAGLDGVDLVFNTPNGKSGPGYLKMGWAQAGMVPISVRPRPLPALSTIARAATASGRRVQVAAPRAAEILEDGASFADLLEEASGEARLHTAASLPYLRWRYGSAPGLDYRAVASWSGSRLLGAAFFRVRRRGRLWETTVAEVIVRPGDSATARALLRAVAASAPTHHVAAHFASRTDPWRAARAMGYLRAPRGMVLVVNKLNPALPLDPARLDAWAFQLGDLEVF